jgi:hypothetical protein
MRHIPGSSAFSHTEPGCPKKGITHGCSAGPPSRVTSTRARRQKPPALTEKELAQLRARHRRTEIIGLIAFCVVLVIVFLMRNYASWVTS